LREQKEALGSPVNKEKHVKMVSSGSEVVIVLGHIVERASRNSQFNKQQEHDVKKQEQRQT